MVAVYYASHIGMGAAAEIREVVLTRVPPYSVGDVNHFGTASLITQYLRHPTDPSAPSDGPHDDGEGAPALDHA